MNMNLFTTLAFAAFTATAVTASPFTGTQPKSNDSKKQKAMSNLMQQARPTENSQISRGLDEAANIDFSKYVLKFDKCQFVKAYDDELAEVEDAATVLNVKRYIVFRLCLAGTCNSCNSKYGEYIIDMASYLTYATEYFYADRESSCEFCEQYCAANDNDDATTKSAASSLGVNCETCEEYCEFVENMDEEGYVESAEYAGCVQVYQDDYGAVVYAGAMCSDSGSSIKIAAFSDADCSQHKTNVDISSYMEDGASLNGDILKRVSDSDTCVSCIAKVYAINDDDAAAGENELCSYLYTGAAKCESQYGFDNYWKDYESFSNQYVQEDLVCDFIDSISSGTYDQYGEIIIAGSSARGNSATGGQIFSMLTFVVGTVGVGLYAVTLRTQLKNPKTDLSSQGGAMA